MVLLLRMSFRLSHKQQLWLLPPFLCHRHLHLFFTKRNRPSCESLTSVVRAPSQLCRILCSLRSPILCSLQGAAEVGVLRNARSFDLKRDLLRRESFSPSQVKMLQGNPYFLAASFDKVASLISFLRAKGMVGGLAGRLLTRTPAILTYTVGSVERKCEFFEDLGIGALGLQKLLTNMRTRSVLSLDIENLQKHIDFLQRFGLNKEEILKVIIRDPPSLFMDVERKMQAILAFFERHGMSRSDFLMLVRLHPKVFGYSIDGSITEKLEFVRGLGISIGSKSGARALKYWISAKREAILCKWEFLKSQGFSEADVMKMVKLQPEILVRSADSLKRNVDYLKDVLYRDRQGVATFPTYRCLSLENRIIPRFTFLNELKEKGERAKKLWLGTSMSPSDDVFEKMYAAGYGKWKAGYQNKEAADG